MSTSDYGIYEYKKKAIEIIEGWIFSAGLKSYEVTDKVKEVCRGMGLSKDEIEKLNTWRDTIYASEDKSTVDFILDRMFRLIKAIMAEKHEEEIRKIKTEQKDENYWKKYYGNVTSEDIKNDATITNTDLDEKTKQECIANIEMDLAKKNVSGERLSQRLGVSDWREK